MDAYGTYIKPYVRAAAGPAGPGGELRREVLCASCVRESECRPPLLSLNSKACSKATHHSPYTSPRSAYRLALPASECGELGQLGLRAQALDRVEALGEHRVGCESVYGGVA